MKNFAFAVATVLGLGLLAGPAAAAPGAGAASSVQVPTAGVTEVGVRGCGVFDRRCRRGADFRLRAPGVGIYIGGDRDRYRHRSHRHHRYHHRHHHHDRRWRHRWRH